MRVTYIERSPSNWRLRIEGARGGDGKRTFSYETVKGSIEDARRRRFEILKAHEDGSWAKPDKLTLGAFLTRWVEERAAVGTICAGSAETYGKLLDRHILPALGGHRLQKVTGQEIQALYTRLLTSKTAPLSGNSVLMLHRILTAALTDARRGRLIMVNPMEEVAAPRVRNTRGVNKAVEQAAVDKILRAVAGDWWEDVIRFVLGTGLRRGELCGLRWRDVDTAGARITVAGQVVTLDGEAPTFKEPKTESGRRRVALAAPLVEMLQGRRARAASEALAAGRGSIEDAYVFSLDGVRPLSPETVTAGFRAICDKIGLPDFTFHGLRHTHITHLLRQGMDAKSVSQRVGHSSAAFTMTVYQSVFEEDDRRLAECSSGLLKGRG